MKLQTAAILLSALLIACIKPAPFDNQIVVHTIQIDAVELNSVRVEYEITATYAPAITDRGVILSAAPPEAKISQGSGVGLFKAYIGELQPNTKYYVRAYAASGDKITYGETLDFTTLDYDMPTVQTGAVTTISHNSCAAAGEVLSNGGATITAAGIVWATSPQPTTANNAVQANPTVGTFSAAITGLQPETRYYLRSFVTTSRGTAYGNQAVVITDGQSENTYHIYLPVSNASADQIGITIADRKYNKGFIVSMTADDGNTSAYSTLWALINDKPVPDFADNTYGENYGTFYHANQQAAGDYQLNIIRHNRTLATTDGCGNEVRFRLGMGIMPNNGAGESGSGTAKMDITNAVGKGFRFKSSVLEWRDVLHMMDFGCSFYQHNVNEDRWDKTSKSDILLGMAEDQARAVQRTGRKMRIMAEPDGNALYTSAAAEFTDYVMMTNQSSGQQLTNSDLLTSNLQGKNTLRHFKTSSQVVDWLKQSYATAVGERIWAHFGLHNAAQDWVDCLLAVNDYFGSAGGNDDVWFATMDEVYEYYLMRRTAVITKTIENGKLHITIKMAKDPQARYRDLTLNITGATITGALSGSDNVIGATGAQKQGYYMVNADMNPLLADCAERYTTLLESLRTQNAKQDALYFVNRLAPSAAKTALLNRISSVGL